MIPITHTQLTSEVTFLRNRVEYRLGRDFPTVDEEDRKDAMGDAWLAMCEHNLLYYLDTRALALKWLWQVSKNRLLTMLRDKHDLHMPDGFDAGKEDSGIADFEANEIYQTILASLKPNVQPVFELLCQGFEIKEAAEILGRKLNTTHVQHERAAAKLRVLFGIKAQKPRENGVSASLQ